MVWTSNVAGSIYNVDQQHNYKSWCSELRINFTASNSNCLNRCAIWTHDESFTVDLCVIVCPSILLITLHITFQMRSESAIDGFERFSQLTVSDDQTHSFAVLHITQDMTIDDIAARVIFASRESAELFTTYKASAFLLCLLTWNKSLQK